MSLSHGVITHLLQREELLPQPRTGSTSRLGSLGEWWIVIFPGLVLATLVLAVNLLGDWLRDALNPRLR